jgi:hypothetical protein
MQQQIYPGDLIVFRTPKNQPGIGSFSSGRILNKKPSKNENVKIQIIETASIHSENNKFICGKIIEIPKKFILSHKPSKIREITPTITVQVSCGAVSALWRTDGKTDPIKVKVVDDDTDIEQTFDVNAISAKMLERSGAQDTTDSFVFLDEN